MKILISGSRKLSDNNTYTQMEKALNTMQPSQILHGGAKGVDTLAAKYATTNKLPQTVIKPNYQRYGKAAPLIRNTELVEKADAVLCIYEPGRARKGGTGDTYRKALKAKKPLTEINAEVCKLKTQLGLF
jgi:hypothetical protein